jgi:hypothetical protein
MTTRALLVGLVARSLAACSGSVEDSAALDASTDVAPDVAFDASPPDASPPDASSSVADRSDAASDGLPPSSDAPIDASLPDVAPPPPPPPPPPDFDAIPWESPGYGVYYRDAHNPGGDVFIGYAGYNVQAPWSQAWVSALYRAALAARGVRHVYAVQGPRDASYSAQEIGNSRLIAHLLPRLVPGARVLVAAHSSGAFVAHELLAQLYARGLDPMGLTAGRLSYWNLDGGAAGLTAAIVGRLHRAWFVWSDASGTRSPNADTMVALGRQYPAAGGALQLDAGASGCRAGAAWCVHMTPITERPHDPANASAMADYSAFDAAHPVATAWLTRTRFGVP